MSKYLGVLLSTALLVAWARNAQAQEFDSSGRWKRLLAMEVVLGARTPTGTIGAGAEFSPVDWFVIHAGVGVTPDGTQLASTARVRAPLGYFALSVGPGVSMGKHREMVCSSIGIFGACERARIDDRWDPAYAVQVELSLDGRGLSGFHWRLFVGRRDILNDATSTYCNGVNCGQVRGPEFIYGGGAVGWAFDL